MAKSIYFVVHNFSGSAGGGVNRVISETANELSKDLNYDVNILSLADLEGTAYPVVEKVKLHSLGMEKHSTTQYKGFFKVFWLFFSFIAVYNFYREQEQPSTWNLTSPPLIILFAFMFKGKNKFINCEHTSPQRKKSNFITDFFYKFFLNRGDLTVSLNQHDQHYYEKKGIKSKLIHNGIKFPEKIEKEKEKTIIFVGRFEYEKNPLAALEIFYASELWKNDYKLKLFGYGKYHKDILSGINEYGMENYVEIISNEKNPDKIYYKAKYLIMTSKFEGFGMVLVEAMSRGVPCIAYDCPNGPSDIIHDGVNGYLIPNQNKEIFIKKLKEIPFFELNQVMESVQKFNILNIVENWKLLMDRNF